jgi:hypothetical protein
MPVYPVLRTPKERFIRFLCPGAVPGAVLLCCFETYAMLWIESGMPVNKVSSCMHVTDSRLWTDVPPPYRSL